MEGGRSQVKILMPTKDGLIILEGDLAWKCQHNKNNLYQLREDDKFPNIIKKNHSGERKFADKTSQF